MKIHSDTLSLLEIRKAATVAGVRFTRLGEKGSRSRDHAFDCILSGSSNRRQNTNDDPDFAATWDEWGIFLATLYAVDAQVVTNYVDAEHFHWSTGDRFRSPYRDPVAENFEKGHDHHWDYSGDSVTGSYSVHECTCGAIRRWLSHRLTWADFTAANA